MKPYPLRRVVVVHTISARRPSSPCIVMNTYRANRRHGIPTCSIHHPLHEFSCLLLIVRESKYFQITILRNGIAVNFNHHFISDIRRRCCQEGTNERTTGINDLF